MLGPKFRQETDDQPKGEVTLYQETHMHSVDYAAMPWKDVCLSVHPSHAGTESKRLNI